MKKRFLEGGIKGFGIITALISLGLICLFASRGVAAEEEKTYVGTSTCIECHEEIGKKFELSAHARVTGDDQEGVAQGCEMCHGPGSAHVEQGGGKGTMEKPRNKPELCFTCHTDKKAEFHLPYRHPVLEGKMSCADCHDSHGSDARPWTTTSLDGVNGVCFKCHKEQRGPFVFEHEALREGCSSCHKVHGSIHDKMLLARDSSICLRCHTQSNFSGGFVSGIPVIGDNEHDGRMTRGTCWSAGCHAAIHGGNFNDHFRY